MFAAGANGGTGFNNNRGTDKSDWQQRMEKQKMAKLHVCPRQFCDLNADRQGHLTRHLQVADYHIRYWCDKCPATFCRSQALVGHRRTRCQTQNESTDYLELARIQTLGYVLEPNPFAPRPAILSQPQTAPTAQHTLPPQQQNPPVFYPPVMLPPPPPVTMAAPVFYPIATSFPQPISTATQPSRQPQSINTTPLSGSDATLDLPSSIMLEDDAISNPVDYLNWYDARTNGTGFSAGSNSTNNQLDNNNFDQNLATDWNDSGLELDRNSEGIDWDEFFSPS